MAFHDIGLGPSIETFKKAKPDANAAFPGKTHYRRWGKRFFDIVMSLFMLPVLLPVMAILWIWVRSDGGSALFCQPRVGRNGKTFNCYKLRTMIPNAERVLDDMCARDPQIAEEWHLHQKLAHDPRITRIGRILRKTSLDELPQIINVLKGGMSLVGPRPFLPSQRRIYDDAGGSAYFNLRPGVTGLWQVESRHDTTFASRAHFDEAYEANMSITGDLILILRTAQVVLRRTGS